MSLNVTFFGGIRAAAMKRLSAFMKLNVVHACVRKKSGIQCENVLFLTKIIFCHLMHIAQTTSVFKISTLMPYGFMIETILLFNSGVTSTSPVPIIISSSFGSSAKSNCNEFSFISSTDATFHERTVRGNITIGPMILNLLLSRKPS